MLRRGCRGPGDVSQKTTNSLSAPDLDYALTIGGGRYRVLGGH
jgi:hypothetical protein